MLRGLDHQLVRVGNTYKDRIYVKNRLFKPQKNNKHAKQYFQNLPEDQNWVEIEMENPTAGRLYALKNDLEAEFAYAMHREILRSKDEGKTASEGLRRFLIMLALTEEDYAWETAWRRWTRFNRRLRQSQPLIIQR